MPPGAFWAAYAVKLGAIALVLAVLYAVARYVGRRGRGTLNRSIAILDSAALSPHAALHVVKIGTRCLVVGSSSAGVSALAELSPIDLAEEPQQ